MPGEVAEKPSHYTYLKDFRTQQCPDFLQHKCSHHRPYNCFSWHFVNQKRRRPVKKKDGLFNYSPDMYCPRYDETTGVCPFGDECPLLHRVAGDVERRYHPRYFKTCMCVHETDTKGHCVKNGPHCAYAHGPDDLRLPVFDASEDSNGGMDSTCNLLAAHLEKDIQYNEDPNWNDPHYVLVNYKTGQCHRPHRLCRQGYACPSYHNPRDKRRSPKVYKYRSTPCPNVKRGDEWGDPPLCEIGDTCSYCHTRTEQQFHPEIYKSSKCNDMVQTGYCPRGQFCAFAHLEKELNEPWDALIGSESNLSDFVEAVLPASTTTTTAMNKASEKKLTQEPSNHGDQNGFRKSSLTIESQMSGSSLHDEPIATSMDKPELVGKRRTVSLSEGSSSFTRGLGTLHERQPLKNFYEAKRMDSTKESFPSFYFPNISGNIADKSVLSPRSSISSNMYPAEDTVESVIVNAMDEFGSDGLIFPSYEREDQDSLCVSMGSSYPSFGGFYGSGSRPVTIPSSSLNSTNINQQQQKELSGSFGGQTDMFGRSCPPLAPIGSEHAAHMLQSKVKNEVSGIFKNNLAASVTGGDMGLGGFQGIVNPSMMFSNNSNPLSPGVSHLMMNTNVELDAMRRYNQAPFDYWQSVCTDLKKETEDLKKRNKILEEEKKIVGLQRDEALSRVRELTQELNLLKRKQNDQSDNPLVRDQQQATTSMDLEKYDSVNTTELQKLKEKMKSGLDVVEQKLKSVSCSVCQNNAGNLLHLTCSRCFICPSCANVNGLACQKCIKET